MFDPKEHIPGKKCGERVKQIFAVLFIDDDYDCEGIPAVNGPGGMVLPLVGADEVRMSQYKQIASRMARETGKRVVVARFTKREDVEVYNP